MVTKEMQLNLYNNKKIKEINNKYYQILGRDSDPKTITDISKYQLLLRKLAWTSITFPGLRIITKLLYPQKTISHFNVENAVAFTIDDGLCGIDNPNGSMVKDIIKLFNHYNAHATFFTVGSHFNYSSITEVNNLINAGHEICNHNMNDWSYKNYSEEDFEFDLLLTKNILKQYNQLYSSWYRAPFGQLSNNMKIVIDKHNLNHVLPDTFAHDTFIPDPEWISNYILKRVKAGSIILIHMPEKGLREWNYKAIEWTLKGLKKRKLDILNLSEMKSIELKNK